MPLAILNGAETGGGAPISVFTRWLTGVISLGAALWLNSGLVVGSLLWRGRMPTRFYSASSLLERLQEQLVELWRQARVLIFALLVGVVCVARAALRRLLSASSDAAVSTTKTIRQQPALPWLEHHTVKVHDVKLHYVSAGRPSRRLVLLLHGLPETWYCWRHVLRELSRTEWAVAVDLPGFGDSDAPLRTSQYTVDALVPLLREFVAALDREQCALVGGGLGARIGWHLVVQSPETFTHFVAISEPLPCVAYDILDSSVHWKLKHWRRFLYQLPWLPEMLIASGDLDILSAEYADLKKRKRLHEADLQALQFAFARPEDWRGPLMHERQWFSKANSLPPPERVSVPTLQLFGKLDNSYPLDSMYRSLPHLRDTNIQVIEKVGRRPHMERPDVTLHYIQDFIGISDQELEDETDAPALEEQSPQRPSIAWQALEGGYGLLGVGSSIFNKTIDRVNHATALGELYTKSVMYMND